MSTSRIGIIGLPGIASAFEEIGLDVITAKRFVDAAKAIRAAVESDSSPAAPLPVLVEDRRQMGLHPLLLRIQGAATIVVARSAEHALPDAWTSIDLASSLPQYARALGLDDAADLLDGYVVLEDGSVAEAEPSDASSDVTSSGRTMTSDARDTPARVASVSSAFDDADAEDESDGSDLTEDLSDDLFGDEEDNELLVQPSTDLDQVGDLEPEQDRLPDEDDLFDDEDAPAPTPRSAVIHEDSLGDEDDAVPDEDPAPAPRSRRRVVALASQPPLPDHEDDEPAPSRPGRRRAAERPHVQSTDRSSDLFDDDDLDVPIRSFDEEDEDDEFDRALVGRSARTRIRPATTRGMAPVLVNLAGKGGVGKTSLSINLAQRGAVRGELQVCLIDMNRGQGDVAKFLKLSRSNLPTIFEAAQIGDISKAFLSPARLDQVRGDRAERVEFTLVRAPRSKKAEANPEVVTAAVYRQAIAYAREHFDLVVVDTQIIESYDTSGLIDGVVAPLLAEGGWAVGIADQSRPGTDNLTDAFDKLLADGVDAARLMSVVNRLGRDVPDTGVFERRFGRRSRWIGVIHHDDRIRDLMNADQIPHDLSGFAPILDAIIYRIMGMDEFAPRSARSEEDDGEGRPSLLQRILSFGRRR